MSIGTFSGCGTNSTGISRVMGTLRLAFGASANSTGCTGRGNGVPTSVARTSRCGRCAGGEFDATAPAARNGIGSNRNS